MTEDWEREDWRICMVAFGQEAKSSGYRADRIDRKRFPDRYQRRVEWMRHCQRREQEIRARLGDD